MKKAIAPIIGIIILFICACGSDEAQQSNKAESGTRVHPVKFEVNADGKAIGYASLGYLEDQLSDIRFYDSEDKLLLILMPEFGEKLDKVNWTLLSRHFSANYVYKNDVLSEIGFVGDSDFSLVRLFNEGSFPLKRLVVVTTGSKSDFEGTQKLPALDIEYEYITTKRRTAAAMFKIDNYDDPAGYLIYHYDDKGNLASIDYNNPLMKKHKAYQVKISYSGVGTVKSDLIQTLDEIMILPAPVIFEWILE